MVSGRTPYKPTHPASYPCSECTRTASMPATKRDCRQRTAAVEAARERRDLSLRRLVATTTWRGRQRRRAGVHL